MTGILFATAVVGSYLCGVVLRARRLYGRVSFRTLAKSLQALNEERWPFARRDATSVSVYPDQVLVFISKLLVALVFAIGFIVLIANKILGLEP